MSAITVRFEKVGRDRITWETLVREWSAAELEYHIRQRGVLRSRDITVELDGDRQGRIYAGFYCVGTVQRLPAMTSLTI